MEAEALQSNITLHISRLNQTISKKVFIKLKQGITQHWILGLPVEVRILKMIIAGRHRAQPMAVVIQRSLSLP